jgi:hypothetical protein
LNESRTLKIFSLLITKSSINSFHERIFTKGHVFSPAEPGPAESLACFSIDISALFPFLIS